MATANFINECKKGANSNRLGRFNIGNVNINQSQYLNSMTIKDSIYNNGSLLGSIFDKTLDATLINKPSNLKLESQLVSNVGMGVKYSNNTTEYVDLGEYIIEDIKDTETGNTSSFTAYGSGTLLDKPYVCTLNFNNNTTHTIYEFYDDVCTQLGLSPTDSSFINSTITANGNPFTNLESCRTVLEAIEKVSCSYVEIDWGNSEISLKWFSGSLDYEFTTSDYSTLEGSLTKYGPVNVVIIGNSQITGENVTQQDNASIAQNGETQIVIDEPYFLYNQAKRQQAITGIYNRIDGFQYYDIKLTTPYGKPFLKAGNKIRINAVDGTVYDTYVLTHTLKYDGTFSSIIESPALTQKEQTVKNQTQTLQSRIRNTEIIVDKQKGVIEATVERVGDLEESVEILKSDIDTSVVVVAVNEANEPLETKTIDVGYAISYLGEIQSNILPTIIYPDNTHSPQYGYTGITTNLTVDKKISFTVTSGTAIQGEDNKYTFKWSKTVGTKTYEVTRTIIVSTVASDNEQNVVMSNTAPEDTSLLWYNTIENKLRRYVVNEWVLVNDFTSDIKGVSDDLTELDKGVANYIKNGYKDYGYTTDVTFEKGRSASTNNAYYELIDGTYTAITRVVSGSTEYYQLNDGTRYNVGDKVPDNKIYQYYDFSGIQSQILINQKSVKASILATEQDITQKITTTTNYINAKTDGKTYYSNSTGTVYTGERTGNPHTLGLYEKKDDSYVVTDDTEFDNGLQGQITDIIDYVKFDATTSIKNPVTGTSHTGVVTIGKSTMDTQLRLAADVLFFDLKGQQVMYIATDQTGNTKLYIKDAEIAGDLSVVKSITVGNFGWKVDTSDNSLTFGKVK